MCKESVSCIGTSSTIYSEDECQVSILHLLSGLVKVNTIVRVFGYDAELRDHFLTSTIKLLDCYCYCCAFRFIVATGLAMDWVSA